MLSPSGRVQPLAPRRLFAKMIIYLLTYLVCMCVCIYVHAHLHKESLCTQRPKEGTSVPSHYHSPPIPLSQGLSLNLEFKISQVDWKPVSSSPPVSALPTPCGAPGKCETHCLLCGSWD